MVDPGLDYLRKASILEDRREKESEDAFLYASGHGERTYCDLPVQSINTATVYC